MSNFFEYMHYELKLEGKEYVNSLNLTLMACMGGPILRKFSLRRLQTIVMHKKVSFENLFKNCFGIL